MTQHSHTNPSLHDIEKDETNEAHETNTAQHSLAAIARFSERAGKDAAALRANNEANKKGFPEDD